MNRLLTGGALTITGVDRPQRAEGASDDLDLLAVGRSLWRHKFLPLGCLAASLLVTAAYIGRMPEVFEAEALVMLTGQARPAEIPGTSPPATPNEEGLSNQLLLLTSSKMAGQLVDRMSLHLRPEFNPALRETGSWALPAWLIEWLPESWAEKIIASTSDVPMTDLAQAQRLREEIVEETMARISGSLVDGSTTASIKFQSTDPRLAADGVNALAELYLAEQLTAKRHASDSALSFFEPEIERLRASLQADEQAIQTYRNEHALDEAQPSEQQVSELTTQLVISRSETAEMEARLRQVERVLASDIDLPQAAQVLRSDVLTALNLRAVELSRQEAELGRELGPNHPQMQVLRAERAALEESKRAEMGQIAKSLSDEVQVGRSRERALATNIDSLRRQLARYRQAEIGLAALQRDADADRDLLETYINRSKEVASQQKAQMPDAQIIATASMPDEASYPRRPLILGVVAMGSLLLGSLAAFGREALDKTIRSSEQIEELIGLPGLGLVPAIKDRSPASFVLDNPNSPFGAAVRRLRTKMLLTSGTGAPRTILVTSSVPGEGKTSLAVSLGRTNARSGKRTLLIDCDLRRPRVHEVTEVPNLAGLSDVLQNRVSLKEAIVSDKRSGVDILGAGGGVFDPEVLLASPAMVELISAAAASYDLVILDSPPVLSVGDALVLSRLADKTVFLAQWGSTHRDDVLLSVQQLLEAGADMAGVALSQVDVRKHATYSFSDSGHYYDEKYTKYYDKAA